MRKTRASSVVMSTVMLASGLTFIAPLATNSAAAAECSPFTEDIQVSVSDTQGREGLVGWSVARVDFSIPNLNPGHCAGQSFTIVAPEQFNGVANSSYDVTDTNGRVVGKIEVGGDKQTLTVTLLETDITSIRGWVAMNTRNTLEAGKVNDTTWIVNGTAETVQVNVSPATCDETCQTAAVNPSKDARVIGEDMIAAGIILPRATVPNQVYNVTDVLTTPGQEFVCDTQTGYSITLFDRFDEWGTPIETPITNSSYQLTECTPTRLSGKFTTQTVGQSMRINFPIRITDKTQTSWSDTATITSAPIAAPIVVSASARYVNGGGTAEVPTPIPTPTPTETTPAPVVTPTPTVPDPTETSTTPAPSPSTPVETPKPTPKPSKVTHRATLQVDTVRWTDARWANRYFALANDRKLKPGEGKPLWKEMGRKNGKLKERARFVTVTVTTDKGKKPTDLQWAQAAAKKLKLSAPKTTSNRNVTRAKSGTATYFWKLESGATARKPMGSKYNIAQTFVARG